MPKVNGPRQAVKLPPAPTTTKGATAMLPLTGPLKKTQVVAMDDAKTQAKKIPAATTLSRSCSRKSRGPYRKPKLGPNQRLLDEFFCGSANGPIGDQNGLEAQL